MASVFKRTGSKKYTIGYLDEHGKQREQVGSYDKAVTWEIARKIDADVQLRLRGVVDMEQERQIKDSRRPLKELVREFEDHLESKGVTTKHMDSTIGYIKKIIKACGFHNAGDLEADPVETYLNSLHRKGLGVAAVNMRGTSIKAFANWLWKRNRLPTNPLKSLTKRNARMDVRHKRRALTDEEIEKLLAAAESGQPYRWRIGRTKNSPVRTISGHERAMLYRLALETGFRASESGSLRRESFDLRDLDAATVTVEACYSKHRRKDVQPIRREFAELVAKFIMSRPADQPVFTLPYKAGDLMQMDLKAAGIPYGDKKTGFADFHCLRHTFISRLVRSGVVPAVAQKLARHSTITLTMDHYTHVLKDDERAALNRLPSLKQPVTEKPAATE